MKYRIEISEESLRIIGLAVEEYMRIRMGQFETLSEDLVYEGKDRGKLYEDQYKFGVYNERSRSVEKMFNLGYQMAFPPFGNRERQHDSWGTCIDLVHAIEEIGKQLGMKPEEIFRLSGFTKDEFLNMMTKGHDTYSKAQVIRSV